MAKQVCVFLVFVFLYSCGAGADSSPLQHEEAKDRPPATQPVEPRKDSSGVQAPDTLSTFTGREVPVLCYHHISTNGQQAEYTVTETAFRQQLKLLADSGYQAILPDQLHAYLTAGASLPPKPVMISFDDTRLEHFTLAAPALEEHGFRGVFFCMTISIGKKNYMNEEQIRSLSGRGHLIGNHSWDHQNVKHLAGEEWSTQFAAPKERLEKITGKPVQYFAYPFGIWNTEAITQLQASGHRAAFQLAGAKDSSSPLYTLRRMIVPGGWSAGKMHGYMKSNFK